MHMLPSFQQQILEQNKLLFLQPGVLKIIGLLARSAFLSSKRRETIETIDLNFRLLRQHPRYNRAKYGITHILVLPTDVYAHQLQGEYSVAFPYLPKRLSRIRTADRHHRQ